LLEAFYCCDAGSGGYRGNGEFLRAFSLSGNTCKVEKCCNPILIEGITGILFVQNEISGNKMVSKKALIRHPNPIHQLPESFFDVTSAER